MDQNNVEIGDVNEVKPQMSEQGKIAGAIIIAGLIIAGAVLLKGNSPSGYNVVKSPDGTPIELARKVSKDEHIAGNPNGKIVIVEYSDLECPFCKVFHKTMQQIIAENSDVAWVYRHYPIPQLHSKATKEAEASECAWAQGGNTAFWEYIDRIFEITTSNDGLADAELPKIANYIGLDVMEFDDCLFNGKYAEKVQADIDDGTAMGVNGTPSSFIVVNGKVVDTIQGAQPYDAIKKKLDALK